MKITFMGAGSTIFARNVLGDSMASQYLGKIEAALYDIDDRRLKQSKAILDAINTGLGKKAVIKTFLGPENRKAALKDAKFVINAIQVGGYDPATITDFEIPKKYGLNQTIGDTIGIGGIMRGLRTIPVMEDFAGDIEKVCPDAWLLNYTNPMSIISGFMQRYTNVKTVGLCHSVQGCSRHLLNSLGMEDKVEGRSDKIAGINHMGWLLEIRDRDGNDLYPEIRKRAALKNRNEKHRDMVRYDYIAKLGYYCTESSEHNAEYNPYYIKGRYPELIEKFNIPLDEYPRRCITQVEKWDAEFESLSKKSVLPYKQSSEYASRIMEAMLTGNPYIIGGNVINRACIGNLPPEACVEIPCLVDKNGINPCFSGRLPLQLAAMNMSNINVHLLTIEAARTRKREHIYHAAMMDPHTSSELSLDDIVKMVDELITRHGKLLPKYKR